MGCAPCAAKRAALMAAARQGNVREAATHAVEGAKMMAAKVMQSPAVVAAKQQPAQPAQSATTRDSTRLHVQPKGTSE